jgi:hypothetical protein
MQEAGLGRAQRSQIFLFLLLFSSILGEFCSFALATPFIFELISLFVTVKLLNACIAY